MTVLLGTVAIEPTRWGTVDPSRRATIVLGRRGGTAAEDLAARRGVLAP